MDYLPLLHNTYALLTWHLVITLMCRLDTFFTSQRFFSTSHTDSPFVGVSDIGQESAYTCKLQELPTGTSQRSSLLCTSNGSTQITRYVFLRNNIQKMFSSQKTTEKHLIPANRSFSARNTQLQVSSQKPSWRRCSAGSYRRSKSWNSSQTTTNLLSDHRVLHISCFARKPVSFVSNSKT
jgi:hypothetical protein